MDALKVGELAKRTGLTIRALHHYDEIGLLKPSLRTESEHRLYTPADVARLQRIVSLRQLGFSLDEIRACLDQPEFAPLDVIRMHLARLRDQLAATQALYCRLESLAGVLQAAGTVSADDLLQTIEAMTMNEKLYTEAGQLLEKLYTPEQKQQFAEVAQQVGPTEIQVIQDGWIALLAELRANMHLDPASAEAQSLGQRWEELLDRTMRPYQTHPELARAIADNYKQGQFEGFAGAPQSAEFAFIERVKAARRA